MRRMGPFLLAAIVVLVMAGYYLDETASTTPDVRRPVSQLHAKSPVERTRAADKLGQMGPAASKSIPDLIGLLGDESVVWLHETDPNPMRSHDERLSPGIASGRALAKIGPSALPYLSDVMTKDSPSAMKPAADAIASIGGDEAMSILRSALSGKDTTAKIAAARAMYKMDDPRLRMLQQALHDPDPQVKLAAIESVQYVIGDSYECKAVDDVRRCLHDSDERVRETAVRAIGFVFTSRTGGQAELDLLRTLHDRSSSVRSEAAFALGSMQSWNALRPLVRRLKDSDPSVRKKAQGALISITGKDFGYSQDKWMRWIAKEEQNRRLNW